MIVNFFIYLSAYFCGDLCECLFGLPKIYVFVFMFMLCTDFACGLYSADCTNRSNLLSNASWTMCEKAASAGSLHKIPPQAFHLTQTLFRLSCF